MALPPVITWGTTSEFTSVWADHGSGADRDGAFYRPKTADGFYTFGDYGQGNYGDPTGTVLTISVAEQPGEEPALKAPTGFRLVWKDKGSGADKDGSFWAPTPPSGYVACGHVVQRGYDEPKVKDRTDVVCLRVDLATQVDLGGLIWNDKGSGADKDVAVYTVPGLNVIFAVPNYDTPSFEVWVPKNMK